MGTRDGRMGKKREARTREEKANNRGIRVTTGNDYGEAGLMKNSW